MIMAQMDEHDLKHSASSPVNDDGKGSLQITDARIEEIAKKIIVPDPYDDTDPGWEMQCCKDFVYECFKMVGNTATDDELKVVIDEYFNN